MAETIITDANGRKIGLRKTTVLDQARMLRAIGPVQASNEPYVQLVFLAMSVEEIDGVPVPVPSNERQIDAAIGRLGDEGMTALMVHFRRQIDDAQEAAEKAAEEGAEPDRTAPLPKPAASPNSGP